MVEAMERYDAAVAEKVVGRDAGYKQRGIELDQECMILQARQAPVAGDLRLIYTVQALTNHMVRAGTLTEHICQAITETSQCERDEELSENPVGDGPDGQKPLSPGYGNLQGPRRRRRPRPAGRRR